MTTKEAITTLRSMQTQIIHGKRIFGDIADLIEALESACIAARKQLLERNGLDRDSDRKAAIAINRVLPPNNASMTPVA